MPDAVLVRELPGRPDGDDVLDLREPGERAKCLINSAPRPRFLAQSLVQTGPVPSGHPFGQVGRQSDWKQEIPARFEQLEAHGGEYSRRKGSVLYTVPME